MRDWTALMSVRTDHSKMRSLYGRKQRSEIANNKSLLHSRKDDGTISAFGSAANQHNLRNGVPLSVEEGEATGRALHSGEHGMPDH